MSDTRKPDTRRQWALARKLKRLAAVALVVALTACSTMKHSPDGSSHNTAGGYRDACGELPGLVGDDC